MRFLLFLLLSASSSAIFSQKIYYISSTLGSDKNDGLSRGKPLKTISRFESGCHYFFKKGDTFYTTISKSSSETSKQKIFVSSYGQGNPPIISTYKIIKPKVWKSYKSNIWVVRIDQAEFFDGFKDTSDSNVGFLNVNGKIFGNKLESTEQLLNNWDFTSINGELFVFSEKDPSIDVVIKIACKYNVITLSDNMELRNISVSGSGGHGLKGDNIENVLVDNVTIKEIGGSYLYKGRSLRYGNGIELWGAARNCLIQNCKVSLVYDAAFTMQGEGTDKYFENVKFINNRAVNNEQSFEFWIRGSKSGFIACAFTGNLCEGAGYGWSHSVRRNKSVGVHILNYHWDVKRSDLLISGNTFKKAKSGYVYVNESSSEPFRLLKNKVTIDFDLPFNSSDSKFTIKQGVQRPEVRQSRSVFKNLRE